MGSFPYRNIILQIYQHVDLITPIHLSIKVTHLYLKRRKHQLDSNPLTSNFYESNIEKERFFILDRIPAGRNKKVESNKGIQSRNLAYILVLHIGKS